MNDKLIINAAITGCVLRKSDTPHLPVTVQEIVDCARRVQDEGASIVHIHARDEDESPSCSPELYEELVSSIRESCGDLIVCASLSGRFLPEISQRSAALAARPDMATLTLGSLNFPGDASITTPQTISTLLQMIYAAGAIPELEVFETGFINYANYLVRKGSLREPYYVNIILGSLGSAPLDLVGLGHMISVLPSGATWSVGGIGRFQLDANVLAIAAGGHVRVGIEDCMHFNRGRTILADNPQLVRRIAMIGKEMGREPATPSEARAIIGMKKA